MDWEGPGNATVLPPTTQHGVHIESTAPATDADDPLRVLTEWLNTQEIKAQYHPGSARNAIQVWAE